MSKNECGIKVPNDVVFKAKKLGSKSCPKYVYRDGDYGINFQWQALVDKKQLVLEMLKTQML